MIRSSQGWGITLRSIMNQAVSFMNKMYHCKLKMFDRIHRIIGPKDHTHILVTSAWGRWWWNLFTTLMQCNMVIYSFPILGFLIQWLFHFASLFQFHVFNHDNGDEHKSRLSSYFTTFPLFLYNHPEYSTRVMLLNWTQTSINWAPLISLNCASVLQSVTWKLI